MALGNWIKMTKGLPNKPEFKRVRRMLGLEDPDVLIGRLFRFWEWMDGCAVPDIHGDRDDGVVPHLSAEDVDEECGRGFSAAMTAVDWMRQRDGEIVLPRYFAHNGSTGKQRAESNKRVTEHRQRGAGKERIRNAKSVTDSLPEGEREEEESAIADSPSSSRGGSGRPTAKGRKPPSEDVPIPLELDTPAFREAWTSWLRHRRERSKPVTATAAATQLRKLAGWGAERAVRAIEHSVGNGWQGVFEEKDHGSSGGHGRDRATAPRTRNPATGGADSPAANHPGEPARPVRRVGGGAPVPRGAGAGGEGGDGASPPRSDGGPSTVPEAASGGGIRLRADVA